MSRPFTHFPALAATVVSLWILAVGPARAETLVTSLSTHRVAITSTYTGAEVVVFGVVERDARSGSRSGPYDIVITVRGPRRDAVVREKERVGLFWVNRTQRHFVEVPGYLAVLSTRPLTQVTTLQLRQRLRLGIDAMLTPATLSNEAAASEGRFRSALRRLEARAGRFVENDRGVTLLTPVLFRARIPLPATAPTGQYEIDIQAFADEAPLARAQDNFEVVKTGFEQQVAVAAREQKLAYGLAVAALALLFGWLASVIFRRD